MNALQVMDRYWKKGDTSEYIKEWYKGLVSLWYSYLGTLVSFIRVGHLKSIAIATPGFYKTSSQINDIVF